MQCRFVPVSPLSLTPSLSLFYKLSQRIIKHLLLLLVLLLFLLLLSPPPSQLFFHWCFLSFSKLKRTKKETSV